MIKQQVIVIGGGETFDTREGYLHWLATQMTFEPFKYATRRKNWKENLERDLNGWFGKRYEVVYLSMPNKLNAKYEEWKIYFDRIVPYLRDGVIFVGHSLGGLFLLKYLDENPIGVITRATMLVSSPLVQLGGNDIGFADFGISANGKTMFHRYGEVHVFQSKDDTIVDPKMARLICWVFPSATRHDFNDRGHFIHGEHFPELVEAIKSVARRKAGPDS